MVDPGRVKGNHDIFIWRNGQVKALTQDFGWNQSSI